MPCQAWLQLAYEPHVTSSNNTFTETASASSNDIFANLDALRLSPDAAATGGTSEILSHVPIRKPNRHEFIRTPVEPDRWFGTGVFIDKEEQETFFVMPAMREALLGQIKPVLLVPTISRQNVLLLWPLAQPPRCANNGSWRACPVWIALLPNGTFRRGGARPCYLS